MWKKLSNKVDKDSLWVQVNTDETYVSDDIIDSLVQQFTPLNISNIVKVDIDRLDHAESPDNLSNGAGGSPGNTLGRGTPAHLKKYRQCHVLSQKAEQNICNIFASILLSFN